MNPHTLHFESRPRQKKNPFIMSRSESWKRVRTIIIKVILAFALILLTIFSLVSCRHKAKSAAQSGDFTIEFLFEHDGCKVYRFIDDGRPRYFSNCRGQIGYSSGGKHPVDVVTLNN